MTFEQWFSNQVFKDEYTVKDLQNAYEAGQKENEELLNSTLAENKEIYEKMAELDSKLDNLAKVAEVRLANWQKYEKENEELKSKIRFLQYAGD